MERGATRRTLLTALLTGPQTAHRLAQGAGIRASATRRHLETMTAEGLVQGLFRQEGLGRPKKYYELTDAGREQLPRKYDALAELMAGAAKEAHGPAGLARVMDAVAARLAAEQGSTMTPDAPLRDRVRAAAEVLRGIGFDTEVEEREDRLVIIRRDCVFRRLAFAHQAEVCGNLDTGLLTRLLAVPVDLVACMPWGDQACRHEVRKQPLGAVAPARRPPGPRSRKRAT